MKPHFRVTTPEQQEAFRKHLQAILATYSRPTLSGWGTPERAISHFRREYEHMPLRHFCGDKFLLNGNYHVIKQKGDPPYYKTPFLLGKDIPAAIRIWQEVRNEWVQVWLKEAKDKWQLVDLPEPIADPADWSPGIPNWWVDSPTRDCKQCGGSGEAPPSTGEVNCDVCDGEGQVANVEYQPVITAQ